MLTDFSQADKTGNTNMNCIHLLHTVQIMF